MRRIPEPELMEDEAQAVAYAAADFSTSDRALVDAFLDAFGAIAGTVLDLGCGPGNIALLLAEALPEARVIGVDGSEAMLRIARARAQDHPAAARLRFLRATLPAADLPRAEAVVSNSLLHHLHRPAVLWEAVRACAAPGAPVLVGDLRRPPTLAAARAIVAATAVDAPPVLQRDFFASLCAAFEVDEVRAQLDAAGLDALRVAEVGERHLRVWGRAPASHGAGAG